MRGASLALILVAASVGFAADQPSVAGQWQVRSLIAGNENDQKCTFTPKDTELTGTCDTAQGGTVNLTGKVEGTKITWTYKSEYNGAPLTANFQGTLEAGKITRTVTVPEFSVDGSFTATPVP